MSQEERLQKVRCYFTDDEWSEMPQLTKERYANIKRNYDAMVGLGLRPAMPEFMKEKPAPPKPVEKPSARPPVCFNGDVFRPFYRPRCAAAAFRFAILASEIKTTGSVLSRDTSGHAKLREQ
ncbi:hypothetical protein HPB50_009340 [Hyalomma asiaticum]|uniref:Uncharacterized protein n=1 Tax=Hyalomma asiaticum TaxID=266040 RepID=A0ACB7T1T7_HYAAI|nr:hypothetical protein HPB50_009340 [Hyalomma asiaticum]